MGKCVERCLEECFCKQDLMKSLRNMIGNSNIKSRISLKLTFFMKKFLFTVEAIIHFTIYVHKVHLKFIYFSFQVLRALKVIAIDKNGSVKMA